ncbi:MAG: FAD-dependent oxidoreductase, partial [Myxococcales bacterium]|nr:FAD-dependent oxidoreductase [Myxococcales bacterium]
MAAPDDDLEVELELGLDEPDDDAALRARVAARLGVAVATLAPIEVRRRAIDARRGRVRFHLTIGFAPAAPPPLGAPDPREVAGAPVVIVGGGPAGLFCAYQLARDGIASIVLDRGKPVQARRKDLKGLTRHGVVDPDSNYCFGEGGAGTYSDGKLYTRAHKRGDVRDVIEVLVRNGAPERILVDARPHIGSNKLPQVVTALRERLEACGVEFRFGARVTGLGVEVRDGRREVAGVELADGTTIAARTVVVAAGHSARDVFDWLAAAGVGLAAKSFAMGVRVEHPQPIIDAQQYGRAAG